MSFSSPVPATLPPRHAAPRRLSVSVALLSLLLAVLSFSSFALPGPASAAATYSLAARCDGVALRTSTSTTSTLKKRIPAGTKVTANAALTGGRWTTVCAGVTKSGSTWYRITSIAGKSVKSLYGVSYLYAATSLFRTLSVTTTLFVQCANTPARTSASVTSTLKTKLAAGARVVSNGTVAGGTWSVTCPSTAKGTAWDRITSINGKSVKTLYGVTYLYVPKAQLATTAPAAKVTPTPTPTVKPTASASATASAAPTPTPTPKPTPTPTPTPIPIGTPLPSQANACTPPTATPAPTATPTPNPSASATSAPTPTPTPAPTPMGGWNCMAGIDVSNWQGTITWSKVASAGYKFAYLKASEGGTYTDPTYATNRANANANGLIIGAYDFAQPSLAAGQAEAEADYFVKIASPKTGDLTPILDLETRNNLTVAQLQDWVRRWMYRVYQRTGVRAAIYVSPSFWSTYMGNTTWFANNGFRVLWIAHWTSGTSPTVPASNWGGNSWSFWQWTSSGTVPGISGRVDLDRFHYTKLSYFLIP